MLQSDTHKKSEMFMSKMLTETQKMLKSVPRWVTLTQISKETDLQITWLSALARDAISDPGVKKIEKLYDYLKLLPTLDKPEFINFSDICTIPPQQDMRGVYVIWAGDLCVYVGVSNAIFKRLMQHRNKPEFLKHNPSKVQMFKIDDYKQRLHFEKMKIKSLKPIENRKVYNV